MNNANLYDLHSHSKRIHFYPEGKGGPIGTGTPKGPVLIYDDGSSQVECSGDDLKVGPATNAGTAVTALVRKTGIVPGAYTSLVVLIPDVAVPPADGAVSVHTIAVLAQHRPTSNIGAGQLQTYSEFAVHGTAALVKLPL
jgi:hypothetical protein